MAQRPAYRPGCLCGLKEPAPLVERQDICYWRLLLGGCGDGHIGQLAETAERFSSETERCDFVQAVVSCELGSMALEGCQSQAGLV